MNILTLQKLTLKNFKGIKYFTFEPNGENRSIFADNEIGKTTLADAPPWLFFGKDSQGKSDFRLKPLDKDGNEIHHLETEVEAVIEYNKKTIVLKKRYYEKYTKKSGEANKAFTGHTTDYFIDDVPGKKKEFDAKVEEILNIDAFKLVTNPYEFSNLHWTDRRQILLDICGDVPDGEVADALFPAVTDKDKFATLIGIINDCGIDDHKKKVKAKKAEINKELEQIPIRITENLEASKDAVKPEQKDKDRFDKDIESYREKLRSLKSNEALSKKQIRLNEVVGEIQTAQNESGKEQAKSRKPIEEELMKISKERRGLMGKIGDHQFDIGQSESRKEASSDAIDKVRVKWHEENDKQPSEDDACPSCGQDLPEDQVGKAIKAFNSAKAGRLEKINAEGKKLKEYIGQLEKDITAAKLSIDTLDKSVLAHDNDMKSKEAELEKIEAPTPADTSTLDKEKVVLDSEIKALKNGSLTQENNTKQNIQEVEDKIAVWNTADAEYKAADKARTRVAMLEGNEKNLSAEFEKLESELFLLEKFIVKKVEMLESSINSKFKMARFKMFKTQVNGGIDECCETLYNGIPFNHGLNNAARINVGLDIINTLSEFYGFCAPVFIDNRESVNKLIPMNAQVISLVVSKDKKLTIK